MPPLPTSSVNILPEFHTQFGMATTSLFGGNILATRGTMTGPGSYEEAINGLNVTGLRYPGGAVTEQYFDITNPDASTATSAATGEVSDFIPISDFLAYAGANGNNVTIVIPTSGLIREVPSYPGEFIPEINAAETIANVRGFVHDLVTGFYGDANITGLEIGNEYWGSGAMTAVEYGHAASSIALAIDSELTLLSDQFGIDTSGIGILVQSGYNFGTSRISDDYVGWSSEAVIDDLVSRYPLADISYDNIRGSGVVNWTEINNELIIMAFDTPQEIDAIHGVLGHVYSYGLDSQDTGVYQLNSIENNWIEKPGFEDLDIHITEWNMKSTDSLDRAEDYGLFQAHEMLNIVENFMAADVAEAHVWPLFQNTANALSVGFEYSGPTAPGQFFSMMSENLPGKAVIDFTPNDSLTSEYQTSTVDVHAFAGQGDMVLYLMSPLNETTATDIDLSNFVAGFDFMEVSVLGVAPGENPGTTSSEIEVQQLNSADVYGDGILEADLDRGEIMQVIIRGIVPTDAFALTLAAIEEGIEVGYVDEDLLDVPSADEDTSDDGDDGFAGLGVVLALLPLLALAGMAG